MFPLVSVWSTGCCVYCPLESTIHGYLENKPEFKIQSELNSLNAWCFLTIVQLKSCKSEYSKLEAVCSHQKPLQLGLRTLLMLVPRVCATKSTQQGSQKPDTITEHNKDCWNALLAFLFITWYCGWKSQMHAWSGTKCSFLRWSVSNRSVLWALESDHLGGILDPPRVEFVGSWPCNFNITNLLSFILNGKKIVCNLLK